MSNVPNIFALGQDAYKDAYSTQKAITNDRTKIQAGRQLAGGDYQGGAATLNSAGMIDDAHNVVADQQVLQDRQQQSQIRARADQEAQKQAQIAGLLKVTDALQAVPEGQRHGWLMAQAPTFQQLGLPANALANASEDQLSDAALAPWKAALGKAAEDFTLGGVRYSGQTKKPIAGIMSLDPTKQNYAVGDAPPAGSAPPPPPAPPADPSAVPVEGAPAPAAVWSSIIQQESRGHPGVTGPQTKYGQAQGETQLLPATAKAMAAKIGVPWQPDLMTATTPEAAQYQEALGKAYFDEGLQKYGGDLQKAAMYYYGGPDEKLWGPKTHAYAQQVLARAGAAGATPEAAAGADPFPAPAPPAEIPGFHALGSPQRQWQDMPDGRQRNVITGKVEGTATAADDEPLSPAAVKLLAGKYLNNGTLPPMGMGKTGTRNRVMVLNEATEQAKTLGLDANDLVSGTVTGKAAAASLGKTMAQRSAVESSERTLLKNGQAALALAGQAAGPTRLPVIDRWIQAGRKATGDADVAAFNLAVNTVATEYAKVMTTTTGTGGTTSDSARQDAERLLNSAMTAKQLEAVINQMKVEVDNRTSSLRETEAMLHGVIRSGGQPGGLGSQPEPAPAAAPPPAPRNRPPLTAIFR